MNIDLDSITQTEYRVMRETLGLPVEWVADKLGVATRSAQRWESNPNNPPIEPAIELIANAYEDVASEARLIVDDTEFEDKPVKLYRYHNQAHINHSAGPGANDVQLHNAVTRFAFLLLTMRGIPVEVHIPE